VEVALALPLAEEPSFPADAALSLADLPERSPPDDYSVPEARVSAAAAHCGLAARDSCPEPAGDYQMGDYSVAAPDSAPTAVV
jgi:hypothetical protein